MANTALARMPALELEDPLYPVLAHPKQSSHRSFTERWLDLDQCMDRLGQFRPHLRRAVQRLICSSSIASLIGVFFEK
ncbi:hypothetical protein [Xanthomonas sp. MUS 060]|uniref:hypothetical protein n=1 Tax=Xanthomonas sp. MUS 060 TaxID=1588031 RepID=UPI000B2BCAC5|nr:hypothetical protein [Xanthomonas sp. MUS 060]